MRSLNILTGMNANFIELIFKSSLELLDVLYRLDMIYGPI